MKSIIGAWDLLSFKHTVIETGVESDIMGDTPCGRIIFTSDGFVSVFISKQGREDFNKDNEKLYKTMMAYMGKYTLDGDKCNFYIDRTWDPDWMDITLQRQIAFDGDTLIITTLPQIGIDGKLSTAKLTWKKIE
ncbi:hypothetical protein CRG86_002985 [Photobacterium leiognathi]|uniref:lipocalin-like domain-containing protein n=1 Tax=Photobacterium leiognathi TaxID=553611 RepID=UPI000C5B3A1E|nr:lipocalin-like domain-containing protein [Photobacterium leiognathi]PHZ60204.1 hypothetical protein CRG86_002985 [Photobacterium leiognathi]